MKGRFFCALITLLSTYAYGQPDTTVSVTDTTVLNTDTVVQLVTVDTAAAFAPQPAPQTTGEVYRLKPGVDIPVTLIAGGWSGYAFTEIYSKEGLTAAQVYSLRKSDINSFDRWAADIYKEGAMAISNIPFYGSMPLPFLLLADKEIRKDAGKVGFLYLQSMALTGLLYTGSTYLFDRYRPLTYNSRVPLSERMEGGVKNSFFAGHVALVGTATFFTAKVFSDYHPDSKFRHVLWGLAVVATGSTAYLRHLGGKHFPSDIIVGTAVGTLSGILVPHLHKTMRGKKAGNLSLTPFTGRSHGLSLVYKL